MALTYLLPGFLVFLCTFLADVCWARYIGHVGTGNRWHAAAWAASLFILGAVPVVGYTKNPWLLIPAVLGAFLGTVAGVP